MIKNMEIIEISYKDRTLYVKLRDNKTLIFKNISLKSVLSIQANHEQTDYYDKRGHLIYSKIPKKPVELNLTFLANEMIEEIKDD